MNLAQQEAHRALAYLGALEVEGYFPTTAELEAYIDEPDRRSVSALAPFARALLTFGRLVHEFDTESMSDYLGRVGWAFERDGLLLLSPLGRAMGKALDRSERGSEEIVDTMLDRSDPIVLARLVEKINSVGPGLLVDPYFRIDQLLMILQATEIQRVLTSERTKTDDLKALSVALAAVTPDRPFEIRVAGREIHDRHVIANDGTVLFIGASLNGIGHVTTVVGKMHDGADAVRETYESLWSTSRQLEPLSGSN
jgi:hypothetical protein